jgi:hypothetical protein
VELNINYQIKSANLHLNALLIRDANKPPNFGKPLCLDPGFGKKIKDQNFGNCLREINSRYLNSPKGKSPHNLEKEIHETDRQYLLLHVDEHV